MRPNGHSSRNESGEFVSNIPEDLDGIERGIARALELQSSDPEAALHQTEALWHRAFGDGRPPPFPRQAVEAASLAASLYAGRHEFDRAIDVAEKAIAAYMQGFGSEIAYCRSLNAIATVHARQGDYQGAYRYYLRTLEALRQGGLEGQMVATLTNIGVTLYESGEPESARDVWREAYKTVQPLGHPFFECACLINCATADLTLGEIEHGLEHASDALGLAHQHGITVKVPGALSTIGEGHDLSGRPHLAKVFFSEALRLSILASMATSEIHARSHLGHVIAKLGDADLGRAHAEHALEMATAIHATSHIIGCHERLVAIERLAGEYEAAFHHLEKVTALRAATTPARPIDRAQALELQHVRESGRAEASAYQERCGELKRRVDEADQKIDVLMSGERISPEAGAELRRALGGSEPDPTI